MKANCICVMYKHGIEEQTTITLVAVRVFKYESNMQCSSPQMTTVGFYLTQTMGHLTILMQTGLMYVS